MRTVKANQLLARLERERDAAGSLRSLARDYSMSPSFLSRIMRGQTPITADLADKMGYRRETIFCPK